MVCRSSKKTDCKSAQSVRVGIFGASGCGKTHKAIELTAKLNRIIFFDPLAEITGCRVFGDINALKAAIKKNFAAGFRFCLVPTFGKEQAELRELSAFLVALQRGYAAHGAQITLMVDELDLSFPSGITQRDPQNWFAYLCRRGRHFGVNLLGISQRPTQIDVCFRSNCSAIYWFRHAEAIDIDLAKKTLGAANAKIFKDLNNFEYIYKEGSKVIIHKNKNI